MYIFTDGGCTKNGMENAKASFSVYFNDHIYTGYVLPYEYELSETYALTINKNNYITPSNNRGELLGIIYGLLYLSKHYTTDTKYVLYSDSLISINTINKWYAARERKNNTYIFKNIDLVTIMMILYRYCKSLNIDIECIHTRGHTKYMQTFTETEKIIWYGNYLVDCFNKILLSNTISNVEEVKQLQLKLLKIRPLLSIHQVILVVGLDCDTCSAEPDTSSHS